MAFNKSLIFTLLLFIFTCFHLQAQHHKTYRSFYENGKFGCKDGATDKIILPAEFDDVALYENGIIVKKQGENEFYDLNGNLKVPAGYEKLYYRNDLLLCFKNGMYEIRRHDGSFFTEEKFEFFDIDGDKIVRVTKNGKTTYGLRFPDGRIELHEEFETIHQVYCPGQTRYRVRLKSGGVVITDSVFNQLSKRIYQDIRTNGCQWGHAKYKLDGRWGLLDGNLQEITEPLYEKMEAASGTDSLLVMKNGKSGVIDFQGNIVFPVEYDFIDPDSHNGDNAVFKKDGLCGVMSWKGDTILPFEYTKIMHERLQYFVTDRSGKQGIFDVNGFEILPVEYDEMEDITYTGQLVILRKDGKFGLYKNQQIVAPVEYENLQRQHIEGTGSFFLVSKNGKRGWLNPDGLLLNDKMYEDAQLFLNGYSRVKENGAWIEIDTSGERKE